MRPTSVPPTRLMFAVTFLPEDFPARLDGFKEAIGLTWDGLAGCLGVDPRQLQRWRIKGGAPNGGAMLALVRLAVRSPEGLAKLLGEDVIVIFKPRRRAHDH